MADVLDADAQDDDQWLYGDDKEEGKEDGEINDKTNDQSREQENGEGDASTKEGGDEAAEKDGADKEKENEGDDQGEKDKDGEKGDDDSSDEDDLTITIGVLKTQPDIIQAPTAPHQARFQPKQSTQTGLKDDDFTSPGKVNGVSITEFNLQDLEDKPWRKPGADISDYFNYGFNEETWFKYCERQKRMRMSESGAGLGGLGISTGVNKPFGHVPNSIPVTIINDNSKYGGSGPQRKAGPPPRSRPLGQIDVIASGQAKPNTIQVMTADRREYSNKILSGPPPSISSGPGYDDMEFGGNPYGESFYVGESYYGGGGNFSTPPPWPGGVAPPPSMDQPNWGDNPPPIPVPPPAVTPVSAAPGYFEQDSATGPPLPPEPDEERHRPRRSHRSRSRSPSRHRHSGSRHARSRSRSPSHRHKRKKSKRERDAE